MILYVPLEWLTAVILAGVTHEAFHAAAVRLCGGKLSDIRFGIGGAVMSAGDLEGWRQPFCLLAGPLGGFFLLLLSRWLPRTAFCGLIHSFYNLLPGEHLDGGRLLRWAAERVLPGQSAESFCWWIRNAVCAVLIVLGFVTGWIFNLGWSVVLLTGWLLYRVSAGRNV